MKLHIASCSFGKDSLAMLLLLMERKRPLDIVVFYDTGMEFQAIYNIRDKVVPILRENGIAYIELKPQNPFIYDMLRRPVNSKEKGSHKGYGWCGGKCRWGTTMKTMAIDAFKSSMDCEIVEYIGIAFDEKDRIGDKQYPLVEWGMTEADCLAYCRSCGYNWLERTTQMPNGFIDLYDILDRVSCWCCCNKNFKELRNIYIYLPNYWKKLKRLQAKIDRPMKNYKNKKYGEYGDVFAMERIFAAENRKGKLS